MDGKHNAGSKGLIKSVITKVSAPTHYYTAIVSLLWYLHSENI